MGAIVQKNHVTIGLVLLNWLLVIDALVILIVGTTMWFFSLRERANYLVVYEGLTRDQRITIQDKVSFITNSVPSFPSKILRKVLLLWLVHPQRHR